MRGLFAPRRRHEETSTAPQIDGHALPFRALPFRKDKDKRQHNHLSIANSKCSVSTGEKMTIRSIDEDPEKRLKARGNY